LSGANTVLGSPFDTRDDVKSAVEGGFQPIPENTVQRRGTPMTKLFAATKKLVREEEGASLAEYGLLLALIALICIAGMTVLGGNINSLFTVVSSTV
jgi:pilus assembly protein Flp/PilA